MTKLLFSDGALERRAADRRHNAVTIARTAAIINLAMFALGYLAANLCK